MQPRRVMLWAPPRTLSTAVERVLIEHPAIQVVHEPFGSPHYWSSEANSTREADDERTLTTYADVAEFLWRAPLARGKSYMFSKNLAYYFAPHCLDRMSQFLGNHLQVVHSFIIRHPAKAITSLYRKSCVDNAKTGYTHFDPQEAGFTAMGDLLDHVEKHFPDAPRCVIIDADDLLEDPEGMMAAYCAQVGLPFHPSMLSWQPGPVKELESPWTGWTDDVINSSGIERRAKTSALPDLEALPLEVQQTIAEAIPIYERMYTRRLRPTMSTKIVPLAKRKPIGASFSLDEVLFRFKTAHPTAASPPCNQGHLVSLSQPIRAVLSADVLLPGAPAVAAAYSRKLGWPALPLALTALRVFG